MSRVASRACSAAAVLALAGSAGAQWDKTAFQPGGALELEGFLVAHETAAGVRAFSALAARWVTVSPPGSIIRGAGDWVVLVEEPNGWRAFSARLDDSALLQNVQAGGIWVHDDVALLVDVSDPMVPTAYAYSAQWNLWEPMPLAGQPVGDDVAISRFVIGIRDEADYLGFSARTGKWSAFHAQGIGAQPVADGHAIAVDQASALSPSLPHRVAAFSGVTGTWSESPDYASGTSFVYDHGVAAVLAAVPGGVSGAAWSAYSGKWTGSPNVHPAAQAALATGDNWVRLIGPGPGVRIEAFGASPGTSWAGLAGSYAPVADGAGDACLVESGDGSEVQAFSGLFGAAWVPLATPGGHTVLGGSESLALVKHGGTLVSAFTPGKATWSTVDPGVPVFPVAGDAVVGFSVGTSVPFTAYAARAGAWTAGPLGTAASSQSVAQGAVFATQAQSGPDKHQVTVFDERCSTFAQMNPGFAAAFVAGDDLLLAVPAPQLGSVGAVHAYSIPRGDWTSPPVALPLSTSVLPAADELAACLVDANGDLWAFGAPNQGHVWYAWPNDSEWQVSSGPPGVVPKVVYSVRAEPGQFVAGLLSPGKAHIDGALFGVGGTLWLPLFPLVQLGLLGVAGPDRVVTQRFPLANQLKQGVEVYWQPFVIDPPSATGFFADRLDASWFF